MKRIIILVSYLILIISAAICQTNKKIGNDSLSYYRISTEDNSSWGFKDKEGKTVIPLGKYKFLNPIDDHGMILAKKGDKEGFIDIV